MGTFSKHPGLRWTVPGVAVLTAAAGVALTQAASASSPPLPERSAAQLLVDLASATTTPVSGTVSEHADLGLDALTSASGAPTSLTSLLTGDHTLQFAGDGPTKVRVAVTDPLGETDVIRNGQDVWQWSSSDRTAVHTVLPAADPGQLKGSGVGAAAPSSSSASLPTSPQQAAAQVLAAVDPTTAVRTDVTATVAGRSAYDLVASPRQASSLIGSVRIAVDAATHVPLRVQVYAKGASSPAFSTAYTSVSFATPAPAEFSFTPPAGATVTQADPGAAGGTSATGTPSAAGTAGSAGAARPTVVGDGWSAVLVASGINGAGATGAASHGGRGAQNQLGGLLASLPAVSGSWGSGHLLRSTLLTVLVTDDGRVLAGAVTPERLYEAAGAAGTPVTP